MTRFYQMPRIHRLAFLLALAALLVAGCAGKQPATNVPYGAPGSTLADRESPELTRLVAAGKLPPLDQRLPVDPMRVRPYDRPGEYGGVWHTMVDSPDLSLWKMTGGYAPLMRWTPTASGVEPGLADRWEYDKSGTQLTIHLRHGLRWSDGAPFTSADLAYWADICASGKSQTTAPYWTLVHGKGMTYTCPDPDTFVMHFAGPNWYVPLHMATGFWEADAYELPKHYMQQFDPTYNHAYKDYSVFDDKNQSAFNPDRPCLWPWHLTAIENAGFRMVLDRNPYYYMTDTLGRQLPYIDQVQATYTPDDQVQVLKVLSGQVDAQFRPLEVRDLALYLRGQKNGHYKVLRWVSGNGANVAFMLNWSTPNLGLRALIRDVRFRKALSLAVDRAKCNQIAWRGLAVPQQGTISKESWHFKAPGGRQVYDAWAAADAAYDLPEANKLLDSMSLTKRDADGYRLQPNGRRIAIMIDMPPAATEDQSVDEALIVADGWRKLGIDATLHNWSSVEITLRQSLGTFDVSTLAEAEMDLFTFPDWVFPTTNQRWHPAVGEYYMTGGKKGEKPTGIMQQLIDIYERSQAEGDIAKSHQIMLSAIRLETKEGFFSIGTAGNEPQIAIVKDNMINVPPGGRVLGPWEIGQPAASYTETFAYATPGAPAPVASPLTPPAPTAASRMADAEIARAARGGGAALEDKP